MLNILVPIFVVWSMVTTFDFIVYALSRAPKACYFAVWMHLVGFVMAGFLIYWHTTGAYVW